MNKAQLVEAVAKELGIPASKGAAPVEAVLNVIARELLLGNSVGVTGFGTFETVHRAGRRARNPQNGETVWQPEREVARWRPGRSLLALLNGVKDAPFDGSLIKKAPKGSLSGGAR
jgi:DNA-binding protein HU-beta